MKNVFDIRWRFFFRCIFLLINQETEANFVLSSCLSRSNFLWQLIAKDILPRNQFITIINEQLLECNWIYSNYSNEVFPFLSCLHLGLNQTAVIIAIRRRTSYNITSNFSPRLGISSRERKVRWPGGKFGQFPLKRKRRNRAANLVALVAAVVAVAVAVAAVVAALGVVAAAAVVGGWRQRHGRRLLHLDAGAQ